MIFKNKVVLILGGTGGIGSAIAKAFKEEGAKVCSHGFGSGKYKADLTDSAQGIQLVEKIIAEFGRVDVLIDSISAPAKIGSFESKTWQDFLKHLNTQLKAAVEIINLLLPCMKKQGKGKIINILSSYVVGSPPSSLSDYVTAKYALLGLTKSLAKELGKYNITVNAVSPNFIKNRFTKNVPDKFAEVLISQTPLKRLATEEDIARAVLFLASEAADYITGENLIVSGGNVM